MRHAIESQIYGERKFFFIKMAVTVKSHPSVYFQQEEILYASWGF